MTLTHNHLVTAVLAIAVATAVGLFALWPSLDDVPRGSQGVPPTLVQATITSITAYEGEPDPVFGDSGERAEIVLVLDEGERAGGEVLLDTGLDGYPPLSEGDRVELSLSEFEDGQEQWFIVDLVRGPSLLALGALFVAFVLLISRWQGLRALLGLAISLFVVFRFVVPAIIAGSPPFLVALVGAGAVLLSSLYLAHGFDVMTSSAVVGTAIALAITIGLGALFIDATALTGFASEDAVIARFAVEGLDLRGLVLAGLVISALGVLDDVTVAQASTVFALRRAAPDASWRHIVAEAMTVGRDHIASTVNTLVLAYVGASLALLLVFWTGGLPLGDVLTSEIVAEEIVKTLVGSMGILAAVPLTTGLAAAVAVGPGSGIAVGRAGHVPHAPHTHGGH